MEYLFFDIECADGRHVCSFGYVITDENFTVKQKCDILINPKCEFKLGKYRKDPYITLAYPEKAFFKSPDFAHTYGQIKDLFSKGRTVLGHAVASDLEFLDIACDRYRKPRFCLSVFDTQKIYAGYTENSEMRSLEKIMEECNTDVAALCAHKSCDDAEMSMLTVKAICDKERISIDELLACNKKHVVDRSAMDITYKKREVRKFVTSAKGRHPESKTWKKIYIDGILNGFSCDVSHDLIRAIFNRGYAVVLDPDKSDYYVGETDRGEHENSRNIDYGQLSELIGIAISNNGEIGRAENNNAVDNLKHYFDSAQKTKKKYSGK